MREMKALWTAVLGLAAATVLAAPATAADPPVAFGGGGASILMWTPEQQAWGYRNMEKIGPVAPVKRGEHVFPLPVAAHPIDPAIRYKGKTYTAESYMAAFRVSGLLVIKDGQIVLERYGLGRRPDERWTSFSVAKSVTSTLIGAAIRDGYIKSLDEPVTTYIPELKGSAYEGVTVRQLITMTSGVKWNEDYTDLNSDVAKVGLSVLEPGVNPVVSYMRKLPREAAPGTKFVYKTGETDLAGILLSNAVHKPMAQYLSEKIWAPFGMEQDAIWVEDIAGHERGGCCMSMTLRDYGRIGLFMLGGGVAGGQPVLPDGWVADATRPHVKDPPYGYFWWLTPGAYEAEGIFGQSISVFPAEHLVVVQNAAWPAAWNDDLDGGRQAMLSAVRAAVK
ncbi:serine hydrolase domain-containing protein [Caulobacter sp. KR2-114]|uniref:serine hydrolase domain-containing protein n=1 Tax=Caulobacter sp. KR2-114 TaxID=3400912 RepID=UPI003C100E7B